LSVTPERLSGVFAPVVTPFDRNLEANAEKLLARCRWLLSQGVGLAVFGTNSEANSLSVDEKIELLDYLVEGGIPTTQLLPGTGCVALSDSVRLSAHAAKLGCAGALMLPPFYYKNVSDDGLFRSYAEIIERVADEQLRVYLYHIPQVAQVGLSADLIERLVEAYPETVVGIKDSSGDWRNAQAMHARQWDDFRLFVGTETLLLDNMRAGGAGCISATANVNPAAIRGLFEQWQTDSADAQQADLNALREIVQRMPMIAALKAIVARQAEDDAWRTLRPPLVSLSDDQCAELYASLDEHGFVMPALA